MNKLQPLGFKIIVSPIAKEHEKTDGGVIGVENNFLTAQVVEFSDDFKSVYKKGDKVLYSTDAGNGTLYNGKPHLFLDGRGAPIGDVWAKITE